MNNSHVQFVIRGEREKAVYREPEIPEYFGNPMIEALPPIWTEEETTEELSYFPTYYDSMRKSAKHIRHHLIQNSLRFFSPLDIPIDLERRFSCLIRVGYLDRNPAQMEFWKDVNDRLIDLKKSGRNQYQRKRKYRSTSASGFFIIGISGIGKSQTIEQILRLYPQILDHNKYKGKNFTYSQLVWLKLDCPFDGSLRGLCYNFFQTIDNLLETTYFQRYAEKARNVDEMIPNMARVAANHCIGVVVIDEIQRLSRSKSGSAKAMLDFFVQIVNTIGIPVVLVGTYKALPILSGAISQMRRGTGQGDLVWDRMQLDDQWELLMESLWDYQYIENKCALDKISQLGEVIYEETQGITDLAIKLFMFAQERAITSGQEKLTSAIIRSAARDKFNLLQPALKAFKNKDKMALADFEDAYPKFLDISSSDGNSVPDLVGQITEEPEVKDLLDNGLQVKKEAIPQDFQTDTETQQAINDFFKLNSSKPVTNPVIKKKERSTGLLPSLFDSIKNPDKNSIYSFLKKAGYIHSGSEFLQEEF